MHSFTNPVAPSGNDPWVVYHGGYYYYCLSAMGGVCVAKMKYLHQIDAAIPTLVWTPPSDSPYSKELWAPELHYIDGEWYIYVACDDGDNKNHRMYALKGTSQNPEDYFNFVGEMAFGGEESRWAIDGTVLRYGEKLYFVWSGWEGSVNYAQNIYIAEMSDPVTISGKRVMISKPELTWERVGEPYINEGPAVIERNGVTHIVYSASGSWTDDYCLGLLTLKGENPLDAGAWEKSEQPILSKSDKVFGPGHCSFTTSRDGSEVWVVYHANLVSGSGWGGRSVWIQPIEWDANNYPLIGLGNPPEPGAEMRMSD